MNVPGLLDCLLQVIAAGLSALHDAMHAMHAELTFKHKTSSRPRRLDSELKQGGERGVLRLYLSPLESKSYIHILYLDPAHKKIYRSLLCSFLRRF